MRVPERVPERMTKRMTEARHLAVDRVPTLTEVLDINDEVPLANVRLDALPPRQATPPVAAADELSADVLFDLEQRINSHFESRLREALAPALARVADGLIRDARQELSAALYGLVEDAVRRALERRTHLYADPVVPTSTRRVVPKATE